MDCVDRVSEDWVLFIWRESGMTWRSFMPRREVSARLFRCSRKIMDEASGRALGEPIRGLEEANTLWARLPGMPRLGTKAQRQARELVVSKRGGERDLGSLTLKSNIAVSSCLQCPQHRGSDPACRLVDMKAKRLQDQAKQLGRDERWAAHCLAAKRTQTSPPDTDLASSGLRAEQTGQLTSLRTISLRRGSADSANQ